jgi:hypothetical protein
MHGQQALSLDVAGTTQLAPADEAAIDVYCWRMEQLLKAGYAHVLADTIAADGAVDLHVACDLLARGCPERTAYLILL